MSEGNNGKFYSYSVKECLTGYFGEDPLNAMRHPAPEGEVIFYHQRAAKHDPLCWQCADEQVFETLSEISFLTGSVLTDDYIAYMLRRGTEDEVILMFMTDTDHPFFRIDIAYAKQLASEWCEKGFKPVFFHVCIGMEDVGRDRYEVKCSREDPEGVAIYTLERVNGKEYLVSREPSCLNIIYSKMLSVSKTDNTAEYECVIDPVVRIIRDNEEIGKGIEDVIHFFVDNGPAEMLLGKDSNSDIWYRDLSAGGYRLNIGVNKMNLISQIELEKLDQIIIPDTDFQEYGSIQKSIPKAVSVRPLDPVQMHALAVQTTYEGENVRNYYLKTFSEFTIPESCDVDGYAFTLESLSSVRLDENQNAVFDNGFVIPRHILYFLSCRQAVIEKPDYTYGDPDGFEIKPVFRLPNKERKSRKMIPHYWGNPDEVFGPCEPWIDEEGNRVSDIAVSDHRHVNYTLEATPVSVEPTGKYGFLKKDGTWLAPPVFDGVYGKNEIGCMLAFIGRDENQKKFLIREEFGAVRTDYWMRPDWFSWTMNPFAVELSERKYQFPQGPKDYAFAPETVNIGKWGFMDSRGEIVIEPQYAFVLGYYKAKHIAYEHYAYLGREVDGEILIGVMNDHGKEIIPCQYAEVRHCEDDIFMYREKGSDRYGAFDWYGRQLVEPRYGYVDWYDKEHRLLGVGQDYEHLGLYSLDEDRMLTKEEYEWFSFRDTYIECGHFLDHNSHFYNYEGHLITVEGEIDDSEEEGLFELWNGKTMQLIRADGTAVSQPEYKPWGLDQKDLASKGFYISREGADPCTRGISSTDGTELIPPVYDNIWIAEDLIIVRKKPYHLYVESDALFTKDGKLLMQGTFRNMRFEGEKWYLFDRLFTFETPTGKEYCKVIDHESIRRQEEFFERNKAFHKAMRERKVPTSYLVDVFLPRMRECNTDEEKDAARAVTAVEIEKLFPLKEQKDED